MTENPETQNSGAVETNSSNGDGTPSSENQSNVEQIERSKKLTEERDKAKNRIKARKESAEENTTPFQEATNKIAEVARAPQDKLIFIFSEKSLPPTDPDLIRVLSDVVEQVKSSRDDVFKDKQKLAEWIYELEMATNDKTDIIKTEIRTYKSKLYKKWAEVVINESEVEAAGKVDRDRKVRAAKSFTNSDEGAFKTGDRVGLEEVEKLIKNGKARMSGGDNTNIDSTSTWDILVQDLNTLETQHTLDPSNKDHQKFKSTVLGAMRMYATGTMDPRLRGEVIKTLANFGDSISKVPELEELRLKILRKIGEDTADTSRRGDGPSMKDLIAGQQEADIEEIKEYLKYRSNKKPDKKNDELETFIIRCITSAGDVNETEQLLVEMERRLSELKTTAQSAHSSVDSEDIGAYQKLQDFLKSKIGFFKINLSDLSLNQDPRDVFKDPKDRLELAIISSPEALYELAVKDFPNFKKRVEYMYNSVLAIADDKPEDFFENALDPMYVKPVLTSISRNVHTIEDRIKSEELRGDPRVKEVNGEKLSFLLQRFRKQLDSERFIRSFSHNIAILTTKRAGLEDIAGYAEQMQSADLEVVFNNERLVIEAAQLFEQKLTQYLSNNNWRVVHEMLQSTIQHGGTEIDNDVVNMLKKRYVSELRSGAIEEWEITRAYRLAKGTQIGATAVFFDLFGEADPPIAEAGDRGAFGSYIGEKLLGIWNIRHHFLRFGQPNELSDLMFAIVEKEGSAFRGWNHKQLKDVKDRFMNARGTERFKILEELSGTPFIELMNFFGVGGILTRSSWRTDMATYHLLEENAELMRKNPDFQSIDVPTGAVKDTRGVDWDKSWENFRRGGTAMMYYWSDKRAEAEVRVEHNLGRTGHDIDPYKKEVDNLTKEYKIELLLHKKRVDPLWYALREKEEMHQTEPFQRSIRGKALTAAYISLGYSAPVKLANPQNMSEQDKKVKQVEDSFMIVQKKALQDAWKRFDKQKENGDVNEEEVWKTNQDFLVSEQDFEIIESEEERTATKAYYESLKESLKQKRTYKNKEVEMEEWFLERGFAYSLGTEDTDLSKYKFQEAGQSIVGRAWGDAHHTGEAFTKLQGISTLLTEANDMGVAGKSEEALHAISKYVEDIVKPIVDMHGPHKASERASQLVTVIDRFFKKDWTARLMPEPIQGMIEFFGWKVSRAREFHGKRAWNWTENETWELLAIMEQNSVINEHDKEKLKKTLGARDIQLGFDFGRSTALSIFVILMLQAISEATQEEQ